MKITSNFQPRNLLPLVDLPKDVQDYFGYIKDDDIYSYRFVQYKGQFYDVFESITGNIPEPWDSIELTSAFSGVLFKLIPENDQVICGLACW